MKLQSSIEIPYNKIEAFCQKWNVRELSLFGSVLRDDFQPGSDIDILVSFDSDAKNGLFEMVNMQDELKVIFGREVDLVSRRGIEASSNFIRRENILNSAEVVYGGQ
jgi:uncharacterized protein